MTQITPSQSVGFRTSSMVVVICPGCGRKRWANKCKKSGMARTTCCGVTMEYKAPEPLVAPTEE